MLANCRSDVHLLAGNVHCHKCYLSSFRLGNFSITLKMSKCVIEITIFRHFLSMKSFCESGQ
ncbi:hypothetical protein C7G83_19240 [Siccibacter turicensis]|uniref:Uncharacterized protein n=1 Tax=Siccibacter turicensis TaxID=357233 RepID=A0A2P8VEP3_9ENTR|nr:hypothetical protein C7G83_19240 [Siccibacter turicensis]